MNQENKRIFWIFSFVTVVGAIFWSVMLVMQQPYPLFITFLLANIVALIVNVICLVIDIKKSK